MVAFNSRMVSIIPARDGAKLDASGFDEEDRRRGRELRKHIGLTILKAIFVVGRLCCEAHEKLASRKAVRGRGSLYGEWTRTFAPGIDPKPLGRVRLAYIVFAPLICKQIGTECPDFIEDFDISAIYLLCRSSFTLEDRMRAIGLARSGEKITAKSIATSMARASELHRKVISLPTGTVRIAINHNDFVQALREAIHEIEPESC